MPEGHTIHRLARDLRRTLGSEPLHATSPQGRFSAGAALIDGSPIARTDAWGKYLFVEFANARILHVHLGLIGKFRQQPLPPPAPRDTVRLRLGANDAWWDLTGPARCDLVTPDERDEIVASLGPDPLRPRSRPDAMAQRILASNAPIGALLLDQRVVAGIGNVYRAEVLFLCRIDPRRPGRSLERAEVDALWEQTVRLMRIGLRVGRIVTTDPAEIGRKRLAVADDERLYVYHQEHCRRCGSELQTARIGGRAIQFCPVDQR